MRLDR